MRKTWMLAGLVLGTCGVVQAETVELAVKSAALAQQSVTATAMVHVTLELAGRATLSEFTRDHMDRTIYVRVDGVLLSSPTVRGRIDSEELQFATRDGNLGGVSAGEIVRKLNSGSQLVISDEG